MSLGLDEVVVVDIAIAPTPVGLAGFGSLLFLAREAGQVFNSEENERIRWYTSLKAVQADFGDVPDSQVVKAATTYYAQSPKPRLFAVGLLKAEVLPTRLRGGKVTQTLSQLKAITDGTATFNINGAPVVVTGIDFSGALEFVGVANLLQFKLDAVTALGVNAVRVSYDEAEGEFVVTADAANPDIDMKPCDDTPCGTALALTVSAGAVVFESTTSTDVVNTLGRIADVDNSFYGVSLERVLNDEDNAILPVADWCEASRKIFFNTTNNPRSLKLGDRDCVGAKLKAKTLSHTITQYTPDANEYAAISVAGRAFTVNFEGTNTTITLFLKRGPTITAQKLTKTEKTALEEKNINAFMVIGGVNVFSSSRMADGSWFDTIHGTDWLQNRIQTDVFNLLYQTTTKIPYTDAGVGLIVQKVEQGLRQGVRNGLIAPGNKTDGTYLSKGYQIFTIPVSEVSTADKGNRIYRGITFEAVGAGALHNVVITGSFSE